MRYEGNLAAVGREGKRFADSRVSGQPYDFFRFRVHQIDVEIVLVIVLRVPVGTEGQEAIAAP